MTAEPDMTLDLGLADEPAGFSEAWAVSGSTPDPEPVPAPPPPPDAVADDHGSHPAPGAVSAVPEGPVPPPVPGTGPVPDAGTGNRAVAVPVRVASAGRPFILARLAACLKAWAKAEVRRRRRRQYGIIHGILDGRPEPVAERLAEIRDCYWAEEGWPLWAGAAINVFLGIPLVLTGVFLEWAATGIRKFAWLLRWGGGQTIRIVVFWAVIITATVVTLAAGA